MAEGRCQQCDRDTAEDRVCFGTKRGTSYLGEVDELLEEVGLGLAGAGLGVGQVKVAGNLGNQGRVAVVFAVPAGALP